MSSAVQVLLSPTHLHLAEQEAIRRQTVNEQRGVKPRNNGPASGSRALAMHKLGAMGEVAVAVHLGLEAYLFSESEPVPGSPDLPYDIDVKTRAKHYYDLIIFRNERPDKKLVLVTIENQKILLHGWCVAGDFMKPEYWSDPAGNRPAYFVPKDKLSNISYLQEIIQGGEGPVVT